MMPEKPKIRNEGDRQELMAEELAGGELEDSELQLGRELRRPARPRPPEEIPERAAPIEPVVRRRSAGSRRKSKKAPARSR